MSEVIRASNFSERNIAEITTVGVDAEAAQATLTAENVQGIGADEFVVVGRLGSETAEVKRVQGVAGQVFTFTSNLSFKHFVGEPVTQLFGDQIKIYSSPNVNNFAPANDTFEELATITIEPDQLVTEYSDVSGGSGFWYKQTYYNSLSTSESDLSDAMAVRGGGYGNLVTVEDVRDEAGFNNASSISDSTIAKRRDEAESEVKGICSSAGYALPLQDGNNALYTPPIIESVTRNLAAGFLLTKEYGSGSPDVADLGNTKIKTARATLKQIADSTLILLDGNNNELARLDQVAGLPDDNTDEVGADGVTPEPPKFTMGQTF